MWQASFCFLTTCFLVPVSSEVVQVTNMSVVERDNITFTCTAFDIALTSWLGPDGSGQQIVYTNKGQTTILDSVPQKNRLYVQMLPGIFNFTSLTIRDAMKTDAGRYECTNSLRSFVYALQVNDPNATVYVTQGTQSTLLCPLTSMIRTLQWIGPPGVTPYNIRGMTTLNINGLPAEFASRLVVHPTTGALIINNTQRSDDNLYKCNVGGPLNYVQLTVFVSPQNPVIANTTEDIGSGRRVIWATEDSQVTVVCQVKGGNPESYVKWLRGDAAGSDFPTSNYLQRNADNTYDVTSTVTVIARRSEDRAIYVCQAEHRTWASPQNASVELYLNLRPGELVMSDPGNLQENFTLSSTCSVSRCRPAANIIWSGVGTSFTSNTEDKATETFRVTSAYQKIVTRQDNGATLQCTITHPALTSVLITSRNLTVWFPPTSVRITNNREVTAGDKLSLICTTGTSNPIADIHWKNSTSTPTGELSATLELSGQYGGKIRYQNLTITPTRYMDGNIITCSAENPQTTVPSVHDSVVLSVTYNPLTVISNGSLLVVTEGDTNVTLMCVAESKPLSTFTWIKDAVTLKTTEPKTDNRDMYTIFQVNRTHYGEYGCIASNGILPNGHGHVSLRVQYPPDINVFASNATTSDVRIRLVCIPNGVPDRYTFGKWQHLWPGNNGTLRNLSSTHVDEHNATLDLNSLSYQDSGIYVCQASNGVKVAGTQEDAITQLVYVLVKAPPVILKIPKNVAGGIGSTIAIQLDYYSNTDAGHVTLQHSNSSKVYKGDSVQEIQINNLPVYTHYVSAKVYRGNVNISINNQEDYRSYTVNVTNNIGFAVVTLEIKPESEPGKPYKFDSSNLQKNQITLSWYPGFHGGFDQTFVIQISMDTILWQNASLVPGGKGEELFNATITELKPNTIYYFRIYAFNIKGNGELADEVISGKTLSVPNVYKSPESSVAGIAGGISAGIVAILGVVIGVFLWRRYQHMEKQEHDKDVTGEDEESTRRSQMKAISDKQDVTSGKEYERLHFTEAAATQYLQLNDMMLEENRNSNKRSPEGDSYEKLHPYANNDIQMYSSLKIAKTSKDSEKDYENMIKGLDTNAEYQ